GIKRKKDNYWEKVPVGVILIASLIYALLSLFHPRRLIFILPIASFMIGYIPQLLKELKVKLINLLTVIFTGMILIYSLIVIFPWYIGKIKTGTKYDYYNVTQPGEPDYKAIQWIRNNTPKNSTLFVLAGNTLNFFEADRLPANRWTYAIPWVFEPFENMKKDINNRPADYLIVDERLLDRFINWGYPHQSNYLKLFLKERYKEVARYDEWMVVYKLK
ncbi:hypothetical protein KW795_00520, partial [Candidatus Microgenomates bacterium]|nr:hypothetical protein [Candidatus Microgenomates bacterium]